MPKGWTTYKLIATILWIMVAGLVTFNVGVVFALPIRQLVFVLALTIGVVILISINLPLDKQSSDRKPRRLMAGMKLLLSAQATSNQHTVPSVQQVKTTSNKTTNQHSKKSPENAKKLSPTEARMWLDDFLLKHQQK